MSLTLFCSPHFQELGGVEKKWLLVLLYFRSYMQDWVLGLPHFFRHVILHVMGLSICSGCTRCFFFGMLDLGVITLQLSFIFS